MATERVQIEISETGGDRVVNVFVTIKREAEGAGREIDNMRRRVNPLLAALRGIGRVASTSLRGVRSAFRTTTQAARTLTRGLLSIRTALLGLAAGAVVGTVLRLADSFIALQNRVRAFVPETAKANAVLRELTSIARRARVDTDSVATIFQRLLIVQDDLGRSTSELLGFTESLSKAVKVSGASAVESSAALIQLSQGIASGTLRGDELRSVLEQLPFVARVIADELGVGIGELRRIGQEGRITADVIFRAFENAGETVDARFQGLTVTLGDAFTVLRNSFRETVGTLLQTTGVLDAITGFVLRLAEALDQVTKIAQRLNKPLFRLSEGVAIDGDISSIQTETTAGKLLRGIADQFIKDVVDSFAKIFGGLPVFIAGASAEIVATVGPRVVELLIEAAKTAGRAFADAISDAFPILKLISDGRPTEASTFIEQIALVGRSLREAGQNQISAGLRGRRTGTEDNPDFIGGLFGKSGAFDMAFASLDVLFELVSEKAGGVIEDAAVKAENEASGFGQFLIDEIDSIQDRFADLSRSVGNSFADALDSIFTRTSNLREALLQLGQEISRLFFRAFVSETVGNIVGGFTSTLLGGGASSGAGNPAVAFPSDLDPASFGGLQFAAGGFAPGAPTGFIRGTTIFPMRGGRIGMAGEAGEEFATPARIGPRGDLGVRVQRPNLTVNQTINMRERPNARGDRIGRRQLAREAGSGISTAAGSSSGFVGGRG